MEFRVAGPGRREFASCCRLASVEAAPLGGIPKGEFTSCCVEAAPLGGRSQEGVHELVPPGASRP